MKGYFHPVKPEKYPMFNKRNATAVTRERLDNKLRFAALRGFDSDNEGKLINIAETIDTYTKEFSLCDVIWPVYPTLFAKNFEELVAEVKKRDMFIFDFWGYVPGSNPDKDNLWGEYAPPESAVKALYSELSRHFIGFDNGEQDGRYIGSFAPMMCPASGSRMELYKNFCRHFEKLEKHMQNDISLLASLNFLHYFAKGGNTILLGAETAQALPNANMWFSYIRGAGKQYGLLWFGNASVWNRWGWKEYSREDLTDPYAECGPECGTSLSLLKRLIYTEYMYGSDILGFESGWLLEKEHLLPEEYIKKGEKNLLSPVGIIQENMTIFAKQHPSAGIMYTPLCLFMDFYNGFVPPRHLYSKEVCRVWGNRSYEAGDYQTHALFSLLYPKYENAGFLRDEEGFLTPTPYGDIADVIFSDARTPVLSQYELILACGEGALDSQGCDKLLACARQGSDVILFSGKLNGADNDFLQACGIVSICDADIYTGKVSLGDKTYESNAFLLSHCKKTELADILAKTESGEPVLLCTKYGEGRIFTFLLPFGLSEAKQNFAAVANDENVRIEIPYELHPLVSDYMALLFDELSIIKVDNKMLQYSVNHLADNKMTLLVCNNFPQEESFSIIGKGICDITEWEISDVTAAVPGYTPKKEYLPKNPSSYCEKGDYSIPAYGVKIFEVSVSDGTIEEKPEIAFASDFNKPLYVKLPNGKAVRDFCWELPWFDNYFTGFKVDAQAIEQWDSDFLADEGEFARLHKLSGIVDFSSMLNHYPGLSLIDNIPGRTDESIDRIEKILTKSKLCGCNKAVITLHRTAENAITEETAAANMQTSINEIVKRGNTMGIEVYIQNGRSLERTVFAESKAAFAFANGGCKTIYNLSHGIGAGECKDDIKTVSGAFLSLPKRDCFGQYSDVHLPLCRADENELSTVKAMLKELTSKADFICFDAQYTDYNELYKDIKLVTGFSAI